MRFDNRMLYSGFLLLMFTFHETQGSLDIKANVQSQSLDENEVLTILMTQMEELKQELQELKPKLNELEQTCAQKKDISVLGEESMPSSEPTECIGCGSSLPEVWVSDSGYITEMNALPIKSISLDIKDDYTPFKMIYHIGSIKCHGARSLPYPTSCQDVFHQRVSPSGWYLLGQPESLYVSFCQKQQQSDQANTKITSDIQHESQLRHGLTNDKFLEEQMKMFSNRLSILDKTITANQRDGIVKINEQKSSLKEIKEMIKGNRNSLMECSSNVNVLKSYVEERFKSLSTTVAFYAYTGKSWSGNLGTIRYEIVTINEFLGYNNETGKFTAPVSGVYYFVANCSKKNLGQVYYFIRKNHHDITVSYLADSATNDSVEKSVILDLQIGDEVDVWLYEGIVYGSPSKAYTSFMGFLLYQK